MLMLRKNKMKKKKMMIMRMHSTMGVRILSILYNAHAKYHL